MKNHEAESTGVAARRPGEQCPRGVANTGPSERNTPPPPGVSLTPPTEAALAAAPPAEVPVAATR